MEKTLKAETARVKVLDGSERPCQKFLKILPRAAQGHQDGVCNDDDDDDAESIVLFC